MSSSFDGNEYRDYIERMKLRTKHLALSAIRTMQRLFRDEAAPFQRESTQFTAIFTKALDAARRKLKKLTVTF